MNFGEKNGGNARAYAVRTARRIACSSELPASSRFSNNILPYSVRQRGDALTEDALQTALAELVEGIQIDAGAIYLRVGAHLGSYSSPLPDHV